MDTVLRLSRLALVATTWISAGLFGLYILAFYGGAVTDGDLAKWNEHLPGLYAPARPVATGGLSLHFAAGGMVLVLGCLQVLASVRNRLPRLHRWGGRVYVLASFAAGIGGLAFVLTEGTIGGAVMSTGFFIYGAATVVCSVQTIRYARARKFTQHRAWALRLFALALGSWLYRMDYGFWLLLAHGLGHTHDFHGPFDRVMAYFFYIPNLILVELLLRSRGTRVRDSFKLAAASTFVLAAGFLLLGTYYFTRFYWGPAIVHRMAAILGGSC